MKLMTSGDIELNPGPQLHVNVNTETTVSVGSTILLNFRLRQLGLRPLDVGGAGDCFLELFLISYMVIHAITCSSKTL